MKGGFTNVTSGNYHAVAVLEPFFREVISLLHTLYRSEPKRTPPETIRTSSPASAGVLRLLQTQLCLRIMSTIRADEQCSLELLPRCSNVKAHSVNNALQTK